MVDGAMASTRVAADKLTDICEHAVTRRRYKLPVWSGVGMLRY